MNKKKSYFKAPILDKPQPVEIEEASEMANALDAEESTLEVAAVNKGSTLYASHDPEPIKFSIMVRNVVIAPTRDAKGVRLVWSVPDELVELFDIHTHIKSGRVIKV